MSNRSSQPKTAKTILYLDLEKKTAKIGWGEREI
jgi:hypothetical protein